ncbi:hypothetical protein EZJ43_09400 [Pedobacter changchengzhani]|uniref:Uncharacterized protein n=1 Tax=Pedobacter changchengzhani TaxID=2529274 RepID=A0A4R5MM63_9SPHI|nr:DsrE family protein [Pedobacter changchengzhani]TDG36209.1 hypothetical protein EZJ43_09400 [Pedobacter changchengzhani]
MYLIKFQIKLTALILAFGLCFILKTVHAQDPIKHKIDVNNKAYKALYVINTADEKHIAGTLRNMNNALDDPRLKDNVTMELIAFGAGVAVYNKTGIFENQLKKLRDKGVHLLQCENTLKERKISKSTLFDFIEFVPSGNGQIIIRSSEGWAIVHP